LESTRPDSPIGKFISKRGEGLHHIAVRVESIELALAHLKASGIRLIDEAPRQGAHNTRVAFIHPSSTHGVLLELVEHGE
jgi:methylmalonyl-CoA/ethylmalonyl-CoA epimerase